MAHRKLADILNDPLIQALLGDMTIVGGMKLFETALRSAKKKRVLNSVQQESETQESSNPPLPKDLPVALLALSQDKMGEVLEWMKKLQGAERKKLSGMDREQLDTLFTLPKELRTEFIDVITGPTALDEWEKIRQWISGLAPKLSPEAKEKLNELKKWADEINKR